MTKKTVSIVHEGAAGILQYKNYLKLSQDRDFMRVTCETREIFLPIAAVIAIEIHDEDEDPVILAPEEEDEEASE